MIGLPGPNDPHVLTSFSLGDAVSRDMRFRSAVGGRAAAARRRILSRSAVTCVLLIGLLAGFALISLPSTADSDAFSRSGTAASSGQLALLDVVVLVDESGSETPAKVADEKATTLEIITSMLNPGSRVTVVGFGGVNNLVANRDPTDVACQPTIASQANLGYLTSCVGKLHRRSEQQGDDTDYAAALGQAMSYFNPDSAAGRQSPPGATKVILMMTDGAVDVSRNKQQYGTDWQQGELTAIDDQLTTARSENVQFWALGFGTDIGTPVDGTLVTQTQAVAYLNTMAEKGAPAVCGGQRAPIQPHAQWVDDPDDVFTTLGQLSADASCSAYNSKQKHIGGGTTSGSLTLQIPEIASGGVISVDRVTPAVQVSFTQPDGQQWTDTSALSGQDNSPVESLHLTDITNDEVGTWTINLTAPATLASEVVRASVVWQGAVRALITANPSSVRFGQPICSELSLQGPRGPLSDPADVPSLQVGVAVTGDGATGQVPISGAGQPGCPTSGAGTYSGNFTAPATPATLTFTGIVTGYGLATTYVPATVTVGLVAAPFTAVIQYPVDPADLQVQAGRSLSVDAVFTNKTSAPQTVLLAVSGNGTSPSIAGTSREQTVPADSSKTVPFALAFPATSPKGVTSVQVTAADATNPQHVYANAQFDVTVTKPPGFWAKYLWYVIGAAIALILIALFVRWRRAINRWRMDVRGLVAYLLRDETQLSELAAKSRWSDSFRFAIRDPDDRAPRLDYEESGLPLYSVRRSGNREVTLTSPAGAEYEDIVLGRDVVAADGTKLRLAFTEDRKRPVPWWAASTDRGPRRRRRKQTPRFAATAATAKQERQTQQAQPDGTPGGVTPADQPPSQEPTDDELW
jgi:von Willebrand factor type A domain